MNALSQSVFEELDVSQQHQAVLAVATSALGVTGVLATLVFGYSFFTTYMLVVCAVALLLFGLVVPIYRWAPFTIKTRITVAHNLIPAGLALPCAFVSIYGAGSFPVASIYAAAVPLLSGMICSVRSAVLWSAFMIGALIIALFVPKFSTMVPPVWASLAGGITIIVPVLLSMLAHRSIWAAAVQGQRDATAALQARHAEEERIQRDIREQERSGSLALMARGVAHDLNNFLTGILGSVGLAQHELQAGNKEAVRALLGTIEQASENSSELSRQLLEYAGAKRQTMARIEVHTRVSSALLLVNTIVPRNVSIDLRVETKAIVDGDPTQFDQVLVNLVRNAGQAYEEEGGEVIVEVGALDSTQPIECDTSTTPLPAGRYAVLQVKDRGKGIPVDMQRRIFDPFVSDKNQGKGLGLASVLGIVTAHSGGIRVHSAPGVGSTFTVFWPEADLRKLPSVEQVNADILIVDDHEDVRDIVATQATNSGYAVTTAKDGFEALRMVSMMDDLKAVVLDVAMPGLDGYETLKQLRQLQPTLPVVLISGHVFETPSHLDGTDECVRFLQKPFSSDRLNTAFNELGMA